MGDTHPPQFEDQEPDNSPAGRPASGEVRFDHVSAGGDIKIEGDVVGRDKVTQNIVNNITNNITNVTRVIRNPAEWQDALFRFVAAHRLFLLITTLLLLALFIPYWIFKNLYLIPWFVYIAAAALLIATAWHLAQRPRTGLRRGVTALTGVGFLAVVGFYGWRIALPQVFPPETFGIAIAELGEGDNLRRTGQAREISDAIYNSLCQTIEGEYSGQGYAPACGPGDESSGLLPNPIAVMRLGVIPDREQARRSGDRIGADVIVWGRVRTTQAGVSVDYEILETLDRAVNPEYPLVLPVTSRTTEITFDTGSTFDSAEVEQAVSELTRSIALYTLGLQAYLDRRFPDAVRLLREVAERAEVASALPISPEGLSWVYFYLGRSAHNLQLVDEGQDWLLRAEALNPEEPAISHSLALGYGMLAGEEAARDHYFQAAIDKLNRWLTFNPGDPVAYFNRAEIYRVFEKPRYHRFAELDFEEALALDPDFIAASVSFGRFLTDLGEYERAEALLQEALRTAEKTGANPAWIYLNLGDILQITGQPERAGVAYRAAVDTLPEEFLTHYYLARYAESVGENETALAAYNQVVLLSFNKAWAHEQLAGFWSRQERFDEAANNLEKAVRENPGSALLRAYLGDAYYRAGRQEDAFAEYETALSLDQSIYYVFDTYAVRLERTGDEANQVRAVDLYRQALQVRPLDDFALAGLERIYAGQNRFDLSAAAEACRTQVEEAAGGAESAVEAAESCVANLLSQLAE